MTEADPAPFELLVRSYPFGGGNSNMLYFCPDPLENMIQFDEQHMFQLVGKKPPTQPVINDSVEALKPSGVQHVAVTTREAYILGLRNQNLKIHGSLDGGTSLGYSLMVMW